MKSQPKTASGPVGRVGLDAYGLFLHAALVGLAIVTVVLALENRALKQPSSPANGPSKGQAIRGLDWQPLDERGAGMDLAARGRGSLLFVFTTDCPACKATQPAWRVLHERLGTSIDVVGVSLSDTEATRGYRARHELTFPVGFAQDRAAFVETLAISGVPLTVRIGPDGRVIGSWSGALSDQELAEISEATG